MRPVWGAVYDRIGYRYGFMLVSFMQACVMFCFPMLTEDRFLYLAGVMLSFSGLAGTFTLAPAESMKIFGNAMVYGVLFTAFAFAAVFGGEFANFAAGHLTPEGGNTDETAFRLLAFMSFLAVCTAHLHTGTAK